MLRFILCFQLMQIEMSEIFSDKFYDSAYTFMLKTL